jgi:hypothetical protein
MYVCMCVSIVCMLYVCMYVCMHVCHQRNARHTYTDTKQNKNNALLLTHLLINDPIEVHGLDHIRLELRVVVRRHLAMKQLTHSARELGVDLLRLVTDVHLRHFHIAIWLLSPGQHSHKRGLARSVLSEHHEDLRVSERTSHDVELKHSLFLLLANQRLGHCRVAKHPVIRSAVAVVQLLRHLEVQGDGAESKVLRRDVTCKK